MTNQPTSLTDQQLTQIEARLADEHLTPGPWNVEYDYCDCSEYGCSHGKFATAFGPFTWIESRDGVITTDAEFAAHARTDVPVLVAEVRRLRAELATANARLNATARLAGRQETKLRQLGAPTTVDAVAIDPVCGDGNDGDWCELEPGHEGHHRADTVEWAAPAAPVEAGEPA